MGQAAIVQTVRGWAEQARRAQDDIRRLNGGADPATLAVCDRVSPQHFSSLIEALVALEPVTGRPVSQEMKDLAGLRTVAEVLGLD